MIELLVTSVITALLLIALSGVFLAIMTNSLKLNLRRQVVSETNQILSTLDYRLRNAATIDGCNTGTGYKVLWTNADQTQQGISLASPTLNLTNLPSTVSPINSAAVTVDSFAVGCHVLPGQTKYVITIDMTVSATKETTPRVSLTSFMVVEARNN